MIDRKSRRRRHNFEKKIVFFNPPEVVRGGKYRSLVALESSRRHMEFTTGAYQEAGERNFVARPPKGHLLGVRSSRERERERACCAVRGDGEYEEGRRALLRPSCPI